MMGKMLQRKQSHTANSSFEEAEIAVHYTSDNDCFVSLPTGKSLYYGILPLLFMYSKERESVGYVSPLVSLMIDEYIYIGELYESASPGEYHLLTISKMVACSRLTVYQSIRKNSAA